MSDNSSPWMTRKEAADYWRRSVDTIDRWTVRFGWRTEFGPGGGILLSREDVTRKVKPPKRHLPATYKTQPRSLGRFIPRAAVA